MHEEQAAAGSLVREHDIGPGGSVVVAVEADDVRVRGVDGTTVRLVAPATDHPAVEVVAQPGRYAIRLGQPIRGRVFGFRFGSRGVFGLEVGGGTVELEVPRDARLEISARSGDVSVRDVTGSVAVRTVSGDVSIRGGGGDLRMEAASGNIRAVAVAPIAATVRTISGDVEVASTFAPGGDHVVTTTSGDVELAVHGGVTIDVRTVSGDVDCVHPQLRGGTGRRDPLVIGDGAARVAVRTLSGDIEVRAGRVRPERVDVPGRPAQGAQELAAVPPLSPVATVAAVPPVGGVGVDDAGRMTLEPADTLATLEALARGEIDVAEAERRLGGEGRVGG